LDQKRVVWVADVPDRATLTRLLRAALLHGVASVRLTRTPVERGTHTLQLRLHGEPVVVLAAESRGRATRAGFPLLLTPFDPSHVPELQSIVNASEEQPVPQSMRAHAKTLPDPEPWTDEEHQTDPSLFDDDDEEEGDFDPERAVVVRAPSRPFVDDAATITSSPIVPSSRAARTPRNAVDADATSTARSAASPLLAGMSDPRTTARQVSVGFHGASSAAPVSPVEPAEQTLIPVEHGEPVTSQSSVHTLRAKHDDEITDWDNDGPDASDPSLSESVVFDPDILAREMHHVRPVSAIPSTLDDPEAGADGESVSVIFGTEETLQIPPNPNARSLRDPSQPVNEDSDTLRASSSEPSTPPKSRRSVTPVPARIPSHMPKPGPGSTPAPNRSSSRMKASAPVSLGQPPPTVGALSMPRTQKRSTAQMITGGRIIANRYRIETLVGAGAVGAVFKASHVDLPRTFAIKLLHPHYRADPLLMASFRAEARAASLLDHPNVTVVHDFGEEPDGLVYIVMEYLQGITLQALLDEERRLSPRRAIEILLQVCGALAAAHERGIVHRDVKPDNIMLVPTRDDEGETRDVVKVCDFGIAALETAPGAEGGEITAGTPEYMAPEQAAGRADARTDVYACGIMLYEMLVGKPPFVGETPIATLAKHAKERAKRPTEIIADFPPTLEAIIMCAIEKEPERRFQRMRELRAELKRLLR